MSENKNLEEVYDFLKNCGIFYLATVDGDQPRVRPFGAVNIFENKLYIHTGKKKDVSKQMQANPKIEICGFKNGSWIRVTAKAIRDDRVEAKQDMLDHSPESIRKQYSATDDNTEVLYLKDATATISSMTQEPRTIKF